MVTITTPKGTVFGERECRLIRQLESVGFIRWSNDGFTLKSGVHSHIYVCGREDLTQNIPVLKDIGAHVAAAFCREVESRIYKSDQLRPCLIGVPMAGNSLAQAAAFSSPGMAYNVMRPAKKAYGANQTWVDGKPEPDKFVYATVDNVITDGASKRETATRLLEDGYDAYAMQHFVLVDREVAGVVQLASEGIQVIPLWKLRDLVFAFVELGLWPEERLHALNTEIVDHFKFM